MTTLPEYLQAARDSYLLWVIDNDLFITELTAAQMIHRLGVMYPRLSDSEKLAIAADIQGSI